MAVELQRGNVNSVVEILSSPKNKIICMNLKTKGTGYESSVKDRQQHSRICWKEVPKYRTHQREMNHLEFWVESEEV